MIGWLMLQPSGPTSIPRPRHFTPTPTLDAGGVGRWADSNGNFNAEAHYNKLFKVGGSSVGPPHVLQTH